MNEAQDRSGCGAGFDAAYWPERFLELARDG
jgi:hypothetical protein